MDEWEFWVRYFGSFVLGFVIVFICIRIVLLL